MRLGQQVVFVRRRWRTCGVKLCQRVERSFKWCYLQVGVDPLSGQVGWCCDGVWVGRRQWWRCRRGVLWGSHRVRCVREVGVRLVY